MKRLLILWLALFAGSAFAQGKLHLRAHQGTPPYTYVVKDYQGNEIESRVSSKGEETFNLPANGYRTTISDAAGNLMNDACDPVSASIMRTPAKVFSKAFGSAESMVQHIQNMPVGFNMPGLMFTCADYFQERLPMSQAEKDAIFAADEANWANGIFVNQNIWGNDKLLLPWQGLENPLWSQEFNHTTNTSPGQRHPWDDVIRTAYTWKNAQAGRLGIKLGFFFGREQNTMSDRSSRYSFSYPTVETQARPDGVAHVAPGRGDQSNLMCASFASDQAKTYYMKCLLAFVKRYRLAINDGTIAHINFIFDNSGESQPVLTYKKEDGTDTRNLGDFSVVMRTKLAAHFSSKFSGDVSAFNRKFNTSINAFNASQLHADLLLNGPTILQQHFNWFQMEQMSLFERDIKDYVYQNVNLTREKLWTLDVGGLLDGLIYPRKSLNFNRRIQQQSRWIQIKANNDINFTPYAIDQILSAARYAGTCAMWEPSPAEAETYIEAQYMTTPVVTAMNAGLNVSAFIPSDAYRRWTDISNAANMSGYTSRPKADNLDAAGQPITMTVKFKDVVMDGKYEGQPGEGKIRQAYDEMKARFGAKSIQIEVDDSEIEQDYPQQSSTAPKVPERLAIIGNSFTRHDYASYWHWNDRGMAATAPEKDYVHLLRARVQAVNPSAQVEIRSNGALFEGFYHDNTQWKWSDLTADLTAFRPTAILLRIGENINDALVDADKRNFKAALEQFIATARAVNPDVEIGISTSCWNNPKSDAMVRQVVLEKSTSQSVLKVIDLSDFAKAFTSDKWNSPLFAFKQAFQVPAGKAPITDEGVLQHASDYGMQVISDKCWNEFIIPISSN